MTFASIEAEISDEEFYKVCSEELSNVPSYDISDEEKLNLKYIIYDTVLRYGEGKVIKKENEENIGRLKESLYQLGTSFCEILKSTAEINEHLENIASNGQKIIAEMKETKGILAHAQQYADETRRNLDDTAENIEHAEKYVKGLGKNIKKVEGELRKEKGRFDVQDTISRINQGIKDQKPQQ
jgi:methyl-accepting chemotaxis protein